MIDLDAIKTRCASVDRLVKERPWLWLERQSTPALEDRVELVAEVERLRELVPDAGTLDWLVKAAHRWWKDNGGEGTQKDIEAGYALVKELYREANIDEKRR